jgi:AraC-like DNA-binding protein
MDIRGVALVIFTGLLSIPMIEFLDHGRGILSPDDPIPVRRWDRFDLLTVHRGQLNLRVGQRGREVRLEADTAAIIYPHTRFEGLPIDGDCEITAQHFRFGRATRRERLPGPLQRLLGRRHGVETVQLRPAAEVRRDIDRALRLAYAPPDEWMYDRRVALLALIFSRLEPRHAVGLPGDGPAWAAFEAWLMDHLHLPITVPMMAEQLGVSPSHFTARFRAYADTSPARHLIRLRMQEARRQLRETRDPVKAIAPRLGYPDLPNFYRAFGREVGRPPAAYREQHRLRG